MEDSAFDATLLHRASKRASEVSQGRLRSPEEEEEQLRTSPESTVASMGKAEPFAGFPQKLDVEMETAIHGCAEAEEVDKPKEIGSSAGYSPSRGHAKDISDRKESVPPITLELLSQGGYYDMPMSRVARLLGRTEGSFQRICRALGIVRWPYRVRKSLQAIMEKTEQYLDDDTQEDGLSKAEVLRVLKGHMDDIKGISGSGMDRATKQYRQYIFKVNHKLSRRAAKLGEAGAGETHKVRGMLRAASRIQKPCRPPFQIHEAECGSPDRGAFCGLGTTFGAQHQSEPTVQQAVRSSHTIGLAGEGLPAKPSISSPLAHPVSDRSPQKIPNASHMGADPNNSSRPMRPTPRHFRDLPASLAFEPLGREKAGPANIVGRMATSAAVQNRLRTGTPDDYRQLCMREDAELLQLCIEMDMHLEAAKRTLTEHNPVLYQKYNTPMATSFYLPRHMPHVPMGAEMHPFSSQLLPAPILSNWSWSQGGKA